MFESLRIVNSHRYAQHVLHCLKDWGSVQAAIFKHPLKRKVNVKGHGHVPVRFPKGLPWGLGVCTPHFRILFGSCEFIHMLMTTLPVDIGRILKRGPASCILFNSSTSLTKK